MDRRAFLALFGCGVVGLATDWSGALSKFIQPKAPTGRSFIEEVDLLGDRISIPARTQFIVRGIPMLQTALMPTGMYRWVAAPDSEIVMLEQDPEVYLSGDQAHLIDWQFLWRLSDKCASVTGCEYCGRAFYVWPAGGHCVSCGGALPAPLIGCGRFITTVHDRHRETISLTPLTQSDDRSCDYCGSQLVDDSCVSCGATEARD